MLYFASRDAIHIMVSWFENVSASSADEKSVRSKWLIVVFPSLLIIKVNYFFLNVLLLGKCPVSSVLTPICH